MKISGIYKIQSKSKPDRIYIGSAVNIHKRWLYHCEHLRKNRHHSKKLQRHYDKYGLADLVFSILIGCPKEDLIKTEQFFIDSHHPYFNCSMTAGSTLGTKLTEEHRRKLSESHKGKIIPVEQRKRMADALRGRTRSPEIAKKIVATRMANGGYTVTEETKRKISEIQRGKKRGKNPNLSHPAWNKGKKASPEAIKAQSESHRGKKMPEEQRLKMIGRKLPEETIAKMRIAQVGEKNAMFGKHLSEETRHKLSEAHKGKPSWNKGISPSESTRKKIGAAQKGRVSNRKGIALSEETKQKIGKGNRMAALSRKENLIYNLN